LEPKVAEAEAGTKQIPLSSVIAQAYVTEPSYKGWQTGIVQVLIGGEQVQRDIFALFHKIEAHLSVLRVKAEAEILDATKSTHNGWQRAKELVLELAEKAKGAL
jgi:hypothetical protein